MVVNLDLELSHIRFGGKYQEAVKVAMIYKVYISNSILTDFYF